MRFCQYGDSVVIGLQRRIGSLPTWSLCGWSAILFFLKARELWCKHWHLSVINGNLSPISHKINNWINLEFHWWLQFRYTFLWVTFWINQGHFHEMIRNAFIPTRWLDHFFFWKENKSYFSRYFHFWLKSLQIINQISDIKKC